MSRVAMEVRKPEARTVPCPKARLKKHFGEKLMAHTSKQEVIQRAVILGLNYMSHQTYSVMLHSILLHSKVSACSCELAQAGEG